MSKSNATPRRSRARTIVADQESMCFDDVRYRGGTAFVTFHKDGSQYAYAMSRAEFREWMDADSLGGFFNDYIR